VLPENAGAVAITGLGRLVAAGDDWRMKPGAGAVTAFAAPSGRYPATGWQSSDQAMQVSGTTLLARGSIVRSTARPDARRNDQGLPHGVISMGTAVEQARGIETWLPPATPVVAVTLDARSARLPNDTDLELTVRRAMVSERMVRVGAGQRAIYLFDVTTDAKLNPQQRAIEIGVVTARDVRITGVVGLGGTARSCGERLNGRLPEDWVPDGPLTPDGMTRVRFRKR
jgi:hypothetical protein